MARVFLGVPLIPSLAEKITAWQKPFFSWPVRWIAPKNLHITLLPPWEESRVDELMKKFADFQSPMQNFTINFYAINFGPNAKQPRLIWLEGQPNPELTELKKSLEHFLHIQAENKNFQPHATLARFRPEDFTRLPVKNLNINVHWQQPIKRFALYQSVLSARGADYRILKTVCLNERKND